MLNVAVLSRWHVHADGYAEEFKVRPDVKLTAIWDEEPEKGAAFAQRHGMEFVADLDALLARPDVDAVCVNAPTNMHHEVLVKAAKAGKHIFTEKILALTAAECADIKAAIEASGVKFCISFPHRTMPHNLFAKKVMEEKLLGDVNYMRVRNAHNGASAGWLPPHFYDKTQCGGGAMIDLGAHPMYLIPWIMGKPVEVSSAFTSVTGQAVEDNAVTIMKYANGAIAVSETGFVSSNSPFVMELYGTAGSLIIEGGSVKYISAKNNEGLNGNGGWVTPSAMPAPLKSAINQFVDAINGEGEIVFGIEDAIVLTEMMEAAYKSHETGSFAKL